MGSSSPNTPGTLGLCFSRGSRKVDTRGKQRGLCRPMVLKGQCQNLPDHTIEILSLKPAAQGIYSLGLSVLSKVPAKVKIFPPSQPACFYVSQRAESLHSAPPSPSAGDLRELPRVPLRGEGSCAPAPRKSGPCCLLSVLYAPEFF